MARRYRRFATDETEGISPLYTALAYAVADDRPTLEFLSALPRVKQQPNLLFAAVRRLTGTLDGAEDFLTRVHDKPDDVRQIMLSRSNQMNEPARCGVLMPLLAQIDGPLSLIEVGASAGLCLLPDRYRYRWTRPDGSEHELGNGEPEISLPVTGPVPIPERTPDIVWRAGLDLHPVDLTDPDQREWLLALIWPEHTHRAERLQAAMEVALADPPPVSTGDLRDDLPALVAEAPADSTVVVIHSAVLAYLPSQEEIDAFAATVQGLDVRWLSNEPHQVFPDHNASRIEALDRDFSLMLDGVPVAAAGPHGQSLHWF
ncbi:MAG: DUF2332 domain-containing protein [Acidimicrobiia bacterium]|nr:DUF2332 domain-containing protein [Acidimicrobiia bacterium]